jgi:hypothetical protein
VVRACRRYGPKEERDESERMHACRYVEVSHDSDGMVILRARLEPLAGAAVLRALDAAAEAIYQEGRAASDGEPRGDAACDSPATGAARRPACRDAAGNELTAGQRRADALVLVAESALNAGLDPGTRGERYQVVVHVDAPVIADPVVPGVSALSDGRHISAASLGKPRSGFPSDRRGDERSRVATRTSRRVACDAATVVMTHAPDGSVLDVGRKTRTISPALRRALRHRDRGCRFPGCGLALCDAHHVRHWAEGGETSLENTLLLYRHHHRLVHEEGFQVKLSASGEPEFRRPDGQPLLEAPPAVGEGGSERDPFEALVQRLEDGAVVVDPYTGTPTWDGRRVELGVAVEWFLAVSAKTAALGERNSSGSDCGTTAAGELPSRDKS